MEPSNGFLIVPYVGKVSLSGCPKFENITLKINDLINSGFYITLQEKITNNLLCKISDSLKQFEVAKNNITQKKCDYTYIRSLF